MAFEYHVRPDGDDLAALCEEVGLDAAAVQATVERYNGYCDAAAKLDPEDTSADAMTDESADASTDEAAAEGDASAEGEAAADESADASAEGDTSAEGSDAATEQPQEAATE